VSERRARAEAVLRARGLDPDRLGAETFDPAAARALLAAPNGPVLAEALGEVGNAHTASVLASLDAADVGRAERKAVRRALHRLGERGVAVPAREPQVAHAPLGATAEPNEAWLSATDGGGTRLAWLAAPRASGALVLVATEINEPAGLLDLRTAEVSRKQLRSARRQLLESGIHLVAAPFAVADALVVEAQRRRDDVERRLDYLRVRSRLTSAMPAAPAEPTSSRVAPPAEDEIAGLVADSATLLHEPEIARWWPQPAEAAPFLAEIAEVRDSPIVLNEAQQGERLAAVLARAVRTLYPAEKMARCFAATAYVLAETGRTSAARTALAVARRLEDAGLAQRDVPILTALTHQGLGRLAAAGTAQRRAEREGSLVLTPSEALRARSPDRPERTRS
jgi:hypothetical protein